MDPQLALILGGVGAVLLALAECIRQLRLLRKSLNGQLSVMLELASKKTRLRKAVGNTPTKDQGNPLPSESYGKGRN